MSYNKTVTACNTVRQILLLEKRTAETGSKTLILVSISQEKCRKFKIVLQKIIT